MVEDDDFIKFNFTWKALDLLGKSLYSNAWNAISELVANGFDAGSKKVYVFINAIDKANSSIEIIDMGSGMGLEEMRVYAKVGYDKRIGLDDCSAETVMGRKGIGKLAALYLSDEYYIQTRFGEEETTWALKVKYDDPESVPELTRVHEKVEIESKKWENVRNGTALKLNNVNLSGFGDAAFNALGSKLANQFQLSSMPNKNIYLAIKTNMKSDPEFEPVTKNIAFGNMLNIAYFYADKQLLPSDIRNLETTGHTVKINLNRNTDLIKEVETQIEKLSELQDKKNPIVGSFVAKDGKEYQYRLEGWLGTHATIRSDIAKKNDARFEKDKFYNPSQIRLYVRNKLACEDLLGQLGITQTYANYIEGEVHFDLLDINDLPDIATSNRQSFVENDERWQKLKEILRPIVRSMINIRTRRIKDLKEEENYKEANKRNKAKTAASQNISNEIEKHDKLTTEEKDSLSTIIAAQFEGDFDLNAKQRYKVFISHKSEDAFIANFFYRLLLNKGAKDSDFFYTSDKVNNDYSDLRPMSAQIKESIIQSNTLVVFFTSPYFLKSQYCLFEGGAAWATRAIGDYPILTTVYEGIPEYLTNGKFEYDLSAEGQIELNRSNYNNAVNLLNTMIDHINKGRMIEGLPLLECFDNIDFPNEVELKKTKTTLRDYMDDEIVDYWDTYIENGLKDYEIHP